MTPLSPLEIVNRFSNTEKDHAMSRPFSDDSHTYGCDGRLLVRVPRIAEVEAFPPG